MRSLVFFLLGAVAAAAGIWWLLPERVQLVVQVADEHSLREPPRPLEDDRTAVELARLARQTAELRADVAALREKIAAAAAAPAPAPAPESAPLPPPPPAPARTLFTLIEQGSKVGFDGSSSLHDFTGATTKVKGEIEFRPDLPGEAPRALVEVDARTLDTGNRSRDKDMHHDLESEKWTTIQFRIESLSDCKSESATRFQARACGMLACHGKERRVEAPFKAELVGATGLRIEGELPLRMSDYGIAPPTALGGLIKTHDEVRVWFVLQGRSEP
jgi:polyisoprenoid-binding protein YceI